MGGRNSHTEVFNESDQTIWVTLEYTGNSRFINREIAPNGKDTDVYNGFVGTVSAIIRANGLRNIYLILPADTPIIVTKDNQGLHVIYGLQTVYFEND
jgi:hypothetical protein